jgi:hypothetical protein
MSTETSAPRLRPHFTPEPHRWIRPFGAPLPYCSGTIPADFLPKRCYHAPAWKNKLLSVGIAFGMLVGCVPGNRFSQCFNHVGRNAGIGVFVDGDAGRGVRYEDGNDSVRYPEFYCRRLNFPRDVDELSFGACEKLTGSACQK